jgi:hypothetical protein
MMKPSTSDRFKLRLVLAVLLSVLALGVGLFWSGRQAPSWAAPGQNPYLQTAPTRPSTPPSEPTSLPAPPEQSPGEDDDGNGDVSPAPPPGEEAAPSPTPLGSPASTTASPTPSRPGATETPVPPETAAASQPDDNLVTPDATVINSGEDTSLFSSPLPTPTSVVFLSPLPSPAPSLSSGSNDASAVPSPSPTVASTSVDRPDQPPGAEPSPDKAGSLTWLYALGLGLILILVGIFLVKRA